MKKKSILRLGIVLSGRLQHQSDQPSEWLSRLGSNIELWWKKFFHTDIHISQIESTKLTGGDAFQKNAPDRPDALLFAELSSAASPDWLKEVYSGWYLKHTPAIPLYLLHTDSLDELFEPKEMFRHIYALSRTDERKRRKAGETEKQEEVYWDRLTNLVLDLNQDFSQDKKNSQEKSIRVFVADPGVQYLTERQNLIYELKSLGMKVLPEKSLLFSKSGLKETLLADIEVSDLIIEVLGDVGKDSRMPDSSPAILFQHDLIASCNIKRKNTGEIIPRLLWLPPLSGKYTIEQASFLESLFRGGDHMTGAEIIQAPLEHLKKIIRRQAWQGTNKNKSLPPQKEKTVYVVAESRFSDDAGFLCKRIEETGAKAFPSWEMFKRGNRLSQHYRNIVCHSGVLIYYPCDRRWWLESTLRDIQKAPGYAGTPVSTPAAVYLPEGDDPGMPLSMEMDVIRGDSECSVSLLKPFIDKLNTR